MAVFRLTDSYAFPNPELAEASGLLAVGGDLHPERVLRAYAEGIFPFPAEGLPLTWYSPDPRMLLHPSEATPSRSMRKELRRGRFEMRMDTAFDEVIHQCQTIRRDTWITPQIRSAYTQLHQLGFAHSVETWESGELVGGLYGVSIGRAFFGESMFHRATNASKAAFFSLCAQLDRWRFSLLDCQLPTDHLYSMGAYPISRRDFLALLDDALQHPTRLGRWHMDQDLWPSAHG